MADEEAAEPAEVAAEDAPAEGTQEEPAPPPEEPPPPAEPPAAEVTTEEKPMFSGKKKEAMHNAHKIKRIQIRATPPLTDDCAENPYLPCLPVRFATNEPYRPILYTFRVPNAPDTGAIRNGVARRVPFHVQLDHCVAVVWSLLNKEQTDVKLGIAQVQWTLAFLKALYNRYGEHPKDVQYLIDTMEDYLLEEYAELGDSLDILEEINCTCTPEECLDMNPRDFPFSPNYAEMIKFCPEPSVVYNVPSMTEEELVQELENIKAAAGVTSLENLDSISRDKAIDFLSAWKKDQVEKIQAEIERLKSIENMLKSIDNQRFSGRVDQRLFDAFFQ